MARTELALPGGSAFVDIDPAAPVGARIRAILDTPEVAAAITGAAKACYPSIHWRHGNDVISSDTAGTVVQAFLNEGDLSDALDIVEGWAEDGYYARVRQENFPFGDEDDKWFSFVESASIAAGCDTDTFAEAFEVEVEQALQEADDSDPLDQMKHALDIGVTYVALPSPDDAIDDAYITGAWEPQVSSSGVRPDEAFATLLRFVNVSSDDYKSALLTRGVDLENLPTDGYPDFRHRDIARASEMWRSFSVEADTSRPAIVSAEKVIELLENASYGGVPVIYAYVDTKGFMDLPWSTSEQIEEGRIPDRITLEPVNAKGGIFIGVHDFLNGSGHSVNADAPVTLPLDTRSWHVDGKRYGCGIDDTYGLVKSFFRARPKVVPAPAPAEEVAAFAP